MIEKKYYSVDGARLSAKVIGSGEPVVVLHGFGMNNNHWLPYILPMSREYQFILPDLRGFGGCCSSYECYDDALERHALDLSGLINAFGLKKPHVMGYSLGGLTLLKYLSMFGDAKVGKVTLMDISPKIHMCEEWGHPIFGDRNQERFSSWQSMYFEFQSIFNHSKYSEVPYEDLPTNYQKRISTVLGGFLSDAFKQNWAKGLISGVSKRSKILDIVFPMKCWHVFFDHSVSFLNNNYDFREALSDISVPTTIISGAKSEIFPFKGQIEMAKMIPNSLQLIQKDSGHMVMLDEPKTFYQNLARSLYWEGDVALAPEKALDIDKRPLSELLP